MRFRIGLALAVALLLPGAASAGEKAPKLGISSIHQLPVPLPAPYDRRADAGAAVAAAEARARTSGKPLLIDFGANWCADCRVLAGVLEIPEMKAWVARNFELVQVDIGRFDRNLDLAARYGKKLEAVPAVFVVDARAGKLRNPNNVLALGDALQMKPQAIANWLARWTK
jgi:thiol-disulfide isomerase/thioredoxin